MVTSGEILKITVILLPLKSVIENRRPGLQPLAVSYYLQSEFDQDGD